MWYVTSDQPWGHIISGVFIRGMKRQNWSMHDKEILLNNKCQTICEKDCEELYSVSLYGENVNLFLVWVINLCLIKFNPVVQKCRMKAANSPEHVPSHKQEILKVSARFWLAAECCVLASEFQMSASWCQCLLPDLIKILCWRDFGWDRAPFSSTQTGVNTWKRTSATEFFGISN